MSATVTVKLPAAEARQYPIHIGPSSSLPLQELISRELKPNSIVVVTDENVARLHLTTLQSLLSPPGRAVILPAGEETKSLDTAARLYGELAAQRFERGDLLIALGGGVIGDLTGFVAATWMRGVRWIQLPTTLEAAIDAAVGGKTGVNHAAGKNLIGAFHQPSGVFVGVDFLRTLSDRDYTAGLAESVKHAAIRDPDFLAWHAAHVAEIKSRRADTLAHLIERNCRLKAEVVAADERESGLRAILNHGHTIGHAIEHCLSYELRHGECVALGMCVENQLARGRGWLIDADARRITELSGALGLPSRLPRPLEPAALLAATRLDKKNRAGSVGYCLLRGLGRPVLVTDVADDELHAALATIQPAP